MKKVQVLATKLNNNDVIATSGNAGEEIAHVGKYHLQVTYPNYSGYDNKEICYLYPNDTDLNDGDRITEKPSDLNDSNGTMNTGSYFVELGSGADANDYFYWNGSAWVECTEEHSH